MVWEEKYAVPSSASQEGPARNAIGASAVPRGSCRKTLVHTGRSHLGASGSRLSRMCVSHGSRSMREMVGQWHSARSLPNARSAGAVRETMTQVDVSAEGPDM